MTSLKGLLAMGMSGKTHGMRGWGMFLFGLFVCSLDVTGVELPEKLYFDGNQLVKDALVLEYRKSHPEAMTTYLRARKLYLQILEHYPTWQTESGLVQKKLDELDTRLRPLLLTQGISPDSILQSQDRFRPKTVRSQTQPIIPDSATSKIPKKEMSIDEEIATLRALQAKGETKVPAAFDRNSASPPVTVLPTVPMIARPVAPLSLSHTEKLARLQVEKQQAEQDLAQERQKSLRLEADYQARLRSALAARPKSLEPGEMAKQVTSNQTLRKDLEFLKVQSKRGESDLLDALEELEKARKESEFLRKKFRELQAENQKLRRALSTPR